MIYVVAIGFAIGVSVVQALLLRAVLRVATTAARVALLAVKLPLWAGFFIALALVDRRALLAGGITSGIAFQLAAWVMFHARKARKEVP
jgi:hypothetical protein